eukprot:3494684-Amphidinium_carterae.1
MEQRNNPGQAGQSMAQSLMQYYEAADLAETYKSWQTIPMSVCSWQPVSLPKPVGKHRGTLDKFL